MIAGLLLHHLIEMDRLEAARQWRFQLTTDNTSVSADDYKKQSLCLESRPLGACHHILRRISQESLCMNTRFNEDACWRREIYRDCEVDMHRYQKISMDIHAQSTHHDSNKYLCPSRISYKYPENISTCEQLPMSMSVDILPTAADVRRYLWTPI